MSRRLADNEVKADILHRLLRRGCWGARYFPVETLVRWMGRKIDRDGKRVRRLIKQMVKEEYLLIHKGGKTISLNPTKRIEIIQYIKRFIK